MKTEAQLLLEQYPTSLEEDLDILTKDDEGNGPEPLTENHRNAVLMRSGEKKILHYLIDTADLLLPLFKMTLQDAKKVVKAKELTEDQSEYIRNIVYYLIRSNKETTADAE